MSKIYRDKVALVTGAASGIGRQLRGVARNEAEIVITPHAKGMAAIQRVAPRAGELVGRVQAKLESRG